MIGIIFKNIIQIQEMTDARFSPTNQSRVYYGHIMCRITVPKVYFSSE